MRTNKKIVIPKNKIQQINSAQGPIKAMEEVCGVCGLNSGFFNPGAFEVLGNTDRTFRGICSAFSLVYDAVEPTGAVHDYSIFPIYVYGKSEESVAQQYLLSLQNPHLFVDDVMRRRFKRGWKYKNFGVVFSHPKTKKDIQLTFG